MNDNYRSCIGWILQKYCVQHYLVSVQELESINHDRGSQRRWSGREMSTRSRLNEMLEASLEVGSTISGDSTPGRRLDKEEARNLQNVQSNHVGTWRGNFDLFFVKLIQFLNGSLDIHILFYSFIYQLYNRIVSKQQFHTKFLGHLC